MYTRCTACRTVFHITVADLRAADGRVVCGQCEREFDALETLSDTLPPPEEPREEPAAGSSAEAAPADAGEKTGDEARDEDDFLQEIESLIVDEGDDDFPSPDEVFRVDEDAGRRLQAVIISEGAEGAGADDEPPEAETESLTPDDEAKASPPDPGETRPDNGDEQGRGEDAAAPGETPVVPPPDGEHADDEPAPDDEGTTIELPIREPPLPTEPEPRSRWPRVAILLVVLVAALATWVHQDRGRLLRHPAGQAILAPMYSALGISAAPLWSVGELRILRSAAVADPDKPSSLRVTAEFRNAASFAQPYPVLRVTLEDRWGQEVSVRDFPAAAYDDGHVSGRLMRPGERVQASVVLADPEARADGFRVDLCLPGPAADLVCATEDSS
ncbi:MAG: DUF3426 domain-containing protein [Gammaproteobacteria bacterium]